MRIDPQREPAVGSGTSGRDFGTELVGFRQRDTDPRLHRPAIAPEYCADDKDGSLDLEASLRGRDVLEAENRELEPTGSPVGVERTEDDRPIALSVDSNPEDAGAGPPLELEPVNGTAFPGPPADDRGLATGQSLAVERSAL